MGDKANEEREQAAGAIGAEALFRAHATFVAAFVTRLGATKAEVDDLVQEVFIVAHTKGGYQPGPAHPRTWLAAIALRVVRAKQRSTARRREDPSATAFDAMTAAGRHPGEALEIAESLGRVQLALETLDLEHRAVFVLYEIEGESCQAIADALDIPVGTVYSRLYTARRRFLDAHALQDDDRVQAPRARRASEGV
jgi:RNA polymerase sigma-70 factor (ECF subfamily)